jgi:hypothetical protein
MRADLLPVVRALCIAWLVVFAVGCGPERPVQDPLDYLAAGVDPVEEADRVALQLGRAGFVVDKRLESSGAVALAARRLRDGASAVRIITLRGVALGLDAPDPRFPERRAVRLLTGARFVRREMDGHLELAIEVITHVRCVAVIVVDAGGFLGELSRDENPHPNEGCYPEEPEERLEDDAPELEEGDEIIDEGSSGWPDAPFGG